MRERNKEHAARSLVSSVSQWLSVLCSLVRPCLYSESQIPAMPDHRSASRLRAPFAVSVSASHRSAVSAGSRTEAAVSDHRRMLMSTLLQSKKLRVRAPARLAQNRRRARHRAFLLRFRPTIHRRETGHAPLAVPPPLYRHRTNSLMPAHFIRV